MTVGAERAPEPQEVRVAWWNTGLTSRKAVPSSKFTVARHVVGSLLDGGVDVLALGEIRSADLEGLASSARHRWRTPKGIGRRTTELALGYDPSRLRFLQDDTIEVMWTGKAAVTGWRIVFEPVLGGDALTFVVVHWPSRMHVDAEAKRRRMGDALHRALRQQRDVILLGDFNDEPFNEAISEGLGAFRDRSLVRRRGEAFYNPFWRLLGEVEPNDGQIERNHAGTYFYRSGATTRWFTFDQIIVSSGMLENNAWRLRESATRVVPHDALLSTDGTMTLFDHLPVITTLTYCPEGIDG